MTHSYKPIWLSPDLTGYYCTACGYETVDSDDNSMECPESVSGKYWYEYHHPECVLCGAGKDYKIRKYYKKPEDWTRRHIREEFVCGDHYL